MWKRRREEGPTEGNRKEKKGRLKGPGIKERGERGDWDQEQQLRRCGRGGRAASLSYFYEPESC